MTKQLLKGFSVVALAGAASLVHAQSSVTAYGRVVSGVAYQSNIYDSSTQTTGNVWRAAGNEWGTSFWGFKGVEDLGGGLSVLFQLEGGFNAPKGGAGAGNEGLSFNRRSTVGLKGSMGVLKLGREIPVSDAVWALDPAGQQTMGSATLVKGRNWIGHSNMIYYETPNLGGFSGFVLTSLGEQAGSNTASRKDAIALTYATSGVELRLIYDVVRDANGRYSDLYTTSKHMVLGGTATLGPAKLFAAYEKLSAPDVTSGSDKATHYWLGARYQPSTPLALIAAAYRTKLNNGGGSANLFMLGTEYSLSKRTLLYASVGRVANKGGADFGIVTEGAAPVAGGAQSGFYAGIAHSF
ncbi:porin [Comamonas sp. GB3 AK4-5]|uniref:porin n=1 Tax=Comamonas sp. GB3 AK4-5 TaxID=3231487 RepID=UPI00351DDB20